MDAVVTGERLTRRYGDFTAVNSIDFAIQRGECFGFLGPNGAGKTSTIRMITCRIPPTSGTLKVFQLDVQREPAAIKARMGVVSQEDNLDHSLNVSENLQIYGRYFGLQAQEARVRAAELLDFVELGEKSRALPRELSGGMRRRLAIARALINRPELVVLDEPSTGLDPQARHLVWERLAQLKERNVTLLLTTHYMEEASRLCDRVALMDEGRIKALDTPAQLVDRFVGRRVIEVRRWEGDLPGLLQKVAGRATDSAAWGREDRSGDNNRPGKTRQLYEFPLRHYHQMGSNYYLYTENAEDAQHLVALIEGQGPRLVDYHARDTSLEDVFLELTGRALQAGGGENGG